MGWEKVIYSFSNRFGFCESTNSWASGWKRSLDSFGLDLVRRIGVFLGGDFLEPVHPLGVY